jgi:Mn-dependent DtxR family transcriptional regulator
MPEAVNSVEIGIVEKEINAEAMRMEHRLIEKILEDIRQSDR